MKGLIVAFAMLVVACATSRAAQPLPAGQWAYSYDNGGMAYYDGHAWSYGTRSCAAAPSSVARVRFAAAAPATYQWVVPLTAASYGLMATGSGIVYNAHCTIKTIASNEILYVFFIDTASAAQPGNATAAINGGVSGGMTTAGNDVTWADQTNAALAFTNGIMLAASLTPDTYTAPNAGDVLRCDIKLRSSNP